MKKPLLALTACLPLFANAADPTKFAITSQPFGEVDGKAVELYTFTNESGASVSITNYGGIVTSLVVPDRDGKMGDVVLGFDTVGEYVEKAPTSAASPDVTPTVSQKENLASMTKNTPSQPTTSPTPSTED
jgi:hypothetical protein